MNEIESKIHNLLQKQLIIDAQLRQELRTFVRDFGQIQINSGKSQDANNTVGQTLCNTNHGGGELSSLLAKNKLQAPDKQLQNDLRPANQLSIAERCEHILRKTGWRWIHVDQLLVLLQREYGIVGDKHSVASVLRKHLQTKQPRLKCFGGNRFGLSKRN